MNFGYIFNLKKYAVHDGPGIRTTVFFQGCPMKCWWCHNPESQNPQKKGSSPEQSINCLKPYYRRIPYQNPRRVTVSQLMQEFRKDLIFFDESGGGVTLSGGEPLLQFEFLSELLRNCHEENVHVAIDTSGYVGWKNYQAILPMVNLFLFDLKLMDDADHRKYTGVSNHLILQNLERLMESGIPVIVRIPLIPGITDTTENLRSIAEFLSQFLIIPVVHLLPYNPMGEEKYKKLNKRLKLANLKTQSKDTLTDLQTLFSSQGIRVRIGG
jgi:pyruvate formate lyase activating enzyme